jgi:hypothetical protein
MVLALALSIPLATAIARPPATIYRCKTDTGLTFADRPCGTDSQPYEVDLGAVSVVETVAPKATPAFRAPVPQSRDRPRESPAPAPNTAACRHMDESLRKILATMRSGYSASQGEKLRQRKRDLEARRRQLKC